MKASTCSASSPGSSEPNLATHEQRRELRELGVSAEELEQLWADDGAPEAYVSGTGCGVPCGSGCGTDDRLEGMAAIGWCAGLLLLWGALYLLWVLL